MRPKITIVKKWVFPDGKHYRYYSPLYRGEKGPRPRGTMFNLDPTPYVNKYGRTVPFLNIHTEKQLVTFLRDTYGYGEYWIFAHQKGRKGIFTFWRGSIQSDGWIFHTRDHATSELHRLKSQLKQAESDEEMAEAQEEMSLYHETVGFEEPKYQRYGFSPFLRASGRRGQFNMWDEVDMGLESESLQRKSKTFGRNVDPSMMSLDEINSFE